MPESSSHGSCLQNCRLRSLRLFALTSCIALSISPPVRAQAKSAAHKQVEQLVEENAGSWRQVSKQIWDYAELGYHEDKSSALLQEQLKAAGFSLASGVADEPTAFIASYGQGKPVIAILGEFDPLPGLSQKPLPQRSPVVPNAPGHGCGHNLAHSLTTGSSRSSRLKKERSSIGETTWTLWLPGRR
jgi:aminobenzoyl-glutamate utilization protein B